MACKQRHGHGACRVEPHLPFASVAAQLGNELGKGRIFHGHNIDIGIGNHLPQLIDSLATQLVGQHTGRRHGATVHLRHLVAALL